MIIGIDGETEAQLADAKWILMHLWSVYPNHPWHVKVMPGMFFIRHLGSPYSRPFGMACKYEKFGHSASAIKKAITMYAGEWLERANLRRGYGEDADTYRVEGVPERYLPEKPASGGAAVTFTESEPERTELRPQVARLDA